MKHAICSFRDIVLYLSFCIWLSFFKSSRLSTTKIFKFIGLKNSKKGETLKAPPFKNFRERVVFDQVVTKLLFSLAGVPEVLSGTVRCKSARLSQYLQDDRQQRFRRRHRHLPVQGR